MKFNSSIPVYLQIKEDIIKKIRKGTWNEDEKIPSELKFMKEYKVGRETVRKAIKIIIDEGYLYIKKGIGTFIAQKEVGVCVEPFISLTYFIHMRGLNINTKILEKKELVVDSDLAKVTGLKENTKCLFVKRLRLLENKPIGIEKFHFSLENEELFKNFDFTNGISHYLFEEQQIKITKINMQLEIIDAIGEEKEILELKNNSKMIVSNRTVCINNSYDIFYYLKFYSGENISNIGTDKFI